VITSQLAGNALATPATRTESDPFVFL